MSKYIIRTDGGARGNPGPAALGAVIENEQGSVLKEIAEYIGEKTNNEAEYRAPIVALKKLKSLIGKAAAKKAEVQILADSELMVKQMNGQYKIENENMQKFFLELWNLKLDFANVTFQSVPRNQNKAADRLVNQALDAASKPGKLF
ncbi:MAG TPA: ribonuclease HI family protein [Candidatus Paceibacterota bacterium]